MIGPMRGEVRGLAGSVLATAHDSPFSIAVQCADQRWTYQELADRSRRIAAGLAERHVGAGDRVALVLPRGADAVAAMVAASMLGAAYVPIDPDYPPTHVAELVAQSNPSVVAAAANTIGPQCVTVGQLEAAGAGPLPAVGGAVGDVAYCVFTSGSTGTPRCVQITNSGALNLLHQIDTAVTVAGAVRGSWWTSPAFDVSAWEVWSVLTRGGALYIVPPEVRLEGLRLAAWLRDTAISSAYVPPMMLGDLRDHAIRQAGGWALRRLLVGVEPIRLGLLQEIMAALPGLQILNGYGPAETTVCCTLYAVPRHGGDRRERCPIGTAVPGNRLFVLTDDGTPASEGELYVGGVGVARGYLNDSEQTAARFVPLPDGSGRAYRTGDLVRQRDDGNLVFLGRADRQLKIRGYRVEAAAVEAALADYPAIRESVVDIRETPAWGPILTAYVVPEPGQGADQSKVIRYAASILPPHAVPSLVMTVSEIPQTRNGKIDRAALASLPLPDGGHAVPQGAAPKGTPVSPLHHVLDCVASVLPSGSAAPDASFAELGGTSIAAVVAAGRLRRLLGKEVSAADVLAAPSLTALTRTIAAALAPDQAETHRSAMSGPLLPQQIGIWLADQGGKGTTDYVEHLWFNISGPLDSARLLTAVRLVLQAHPVFTSTVEPGADGLPALVLGRCAVEPLTVDASGMSPAAVRAYVTDFVSQPLPLSPGPGVRCALLTQSPLRHALVIAAHHLLIDGWTARLLTRDIAGTYRNGQRPTGPAAITVCDIGRAQAKRAHGPVQHRQAERAAATVADLQVTLPGGRGYRPGRGPAPARPAAGMAAAIEIEPTTLGAVAELARKTRTSRAAVWLAAFARAIGDVLQAGRSVAGVATSGRDDPDSHELAGCFVNTSLLRLPTLDGSAEDRIRAAAACLLQAMRFQDTPFPLVTEKLLGGRRDRPRRFPPIYFSYDESAELELGPGLVATPRRILVQRAKFDVTLTIEDHGSAVDAVLECRQPHVSTAEMARLREMMETEIAAMAMTTWLPISERR
jgi:amino acid adenylation domain-containing protein